MDYSKLPVGFAMALAENEPAMQKYAVLPEETKKAVVEKARHAASQWEVAEIVSDILQDKAGK